MRMTSGEIMRKLKEAGFVEVGVRGSHHKLRHPDGRTTIVPHPSKDMKPGTVRAIERQTGVRLR